MKLDLRSKRLIRFSSARFGWPRWPQETKTRCPSGLTKKSLSNVSGFAFYMASRLRKIERWKLRKERK